MIIDVYFSVMLQVCELNIYPKFLRKYMYAMRLAEYS